jgi:hypothetical protein
MPNATPPETLYRFCDVPEHAQQLCDGHVHLSTFQYIRNCDRLRADEAEGKTQFTSGDAEWVDGAPINEAARNMDASGLGMSRLGMPRAKYASAKGNTFHFSVPDALVLCMTESCGDDRFRRVFGGHRVAISQPSKVYEAVTAVLRQRVALRRGEFFRVTYVGRTFNAKESPSVPPGAVGPEVNAWEQEVRMLWLPVPGVRVEPMLLHVPEVVGLCSLE